MYRINNISIKLLEPKDYGLHPRTILGELKGEALVIIKDRKSRIIMKDGRQILQQIDLIKKYAKKTKVVLASNAPVCGKTTKYFEENGIMVYQLEK